MLLNFANEILLHQQASIIFESLAKIQMWNKRPCSRRSMLCILLKSQSCNSRVFLNPGNAQRINLLLRGFLRVFNGPRKKSHAHGADGAPEIDPPPSPTNQQRSSNPHFPIFCCLREFVVPLISTYLNVDHVPFTRSILNKEMKFLSWPYIEGQSAWGEQTTARYVLSNHSHR